VQEARRGAVPQAPINSAERVPPVRQHGAMRQRTMLTRIHANADPCTFQRPHDRLADEFQAGVVKGRPVKGGRTASSGDSRNRCRRTPMQRLSPLPRRVPTGQGAAALPRSSQWQPRGVPGETGNCRISTRNIDVDMPTSLHAAPWMAGIAQLVERQVVVLDVTGSSPVARPTLLRSRAFLQCPSLAL
jgi:hypothetical protein